MSRILRRTLLPLGLLVVTLGAAVLYLVNADLTWTRGPVARAASRALGRRLSISGDYHLRFGRVTHLVADDLLLANAPWATDAHLVSIHHLDVALETLSLFRKPVHVLHLDAVGVRINLERDGDGRVNWRPAGGTASPARRQPSSIPKVDRLKLHHVHASLRAPGREPPLELELSTARADIARTGVVDLDLHGTVDGRGLRLAGHVGPIGGLVEGEPFDQNLDFRLGKVEGHLEGRTAGLSTLAGSSLDLELHGPDLAELTHLMGLTGVPGGAFDLQAAVRPAGAATGLTLKATTSMGQAEIGGRVVPGSPPVLDLHLAVSGDDLGSVAALAGVWGLPAETFTLHATFMAHGFPVRVKELQVRTGGALLSIDGTVGRPPSFDGTDTSVEIHAPDTTLLERLTHTQLPTGRVKLGGRLGILGNIIRISDLDARIGDNELRVDGEFHRGPGKPGASFTIDARGPDLAAFDALAGAPLPHGPFQVTGKVSSLAKGIHLESIALELGNNHVEATGTIRTTRDHAGSEVQLSLKGADPTFLASLAGLHGLPAEPFQCSGRFAVTAHSLEIRQLQLRIGGNRATGTVRLARPPSAGPVEFELSVRGENLGDFGPLLGLEGLPPHPYEFSGEFDVSPEDYGISHLRLRCGGIAASADGRLGRPPEFNGTSMTIRASGPDLSELGPAMNLPELPDLPFDIGGALRIDPGGIELHGVAGTLGGSNISVDGALRPRGLPLHLSLDLGVRGQQPSDLTRFLHGLGLGAMPQLPSHPYSVHGHLESGPNGFRLDSLRLALGALQANIDGFLGAPPGYHGTSLQLEASGGNRANIQELTGERFQVEGLRFHCSIRRLEPRSPGPTPLLGIEGSLSARHLAMGGGHDNGATAERSGDRGSPTPPGAEAGATEPYLFSRKPFHLRLPSVAEGTIDCRIATLLLGTTRLQNVHVGIQLHQDSLRLDPITARLGNEGSISATLALKPEESRLATELELRIADARPGALFGRPSPVEEPSLDAGLEFQASGVSPHHLASHANGRFYLDLGHGNIQSSVLDSLGDSLLLQILDALNPFRKREESTNLECAVIAGTIENGKVTLEPMGLTTDKVTTIARGSLDLATEELSISFTSKARRGLGLSASTLTNRYIKIGGTLRKPSVQIEPLSAAAKTGFAVVTGGISLLAEGLWNRVTSGASVCTGMAEEVQKMWNEPRPAAPKPGPGP